MLMAIGNFATSAATGGDDTAPMRWLSRTSQTRPATGDDGHDRILTSPEQRKADTIGLARHLSQQIPSNEANGDQMAVFNPVKGSDLDPFSPDFDIHKWVKALSRFGHSSGIDEARKASVAFSNLSVFGYGSDADYQKTVSNIFLSTAQTALNLLTGRRHRIDILERIDGVLEPGEMLVVLGPPGSGCTTFLKTIAGEMSGLELDLESEINYMGLSPKQMRTRFRGEAIYTAESDVHFPRLTVGDTLSFAAEARRPQKLMPGVKSRAFAENLRNVVMTLFGITHTLDTLVGNDYVRGVSGGERKRVTIAEAALSAAPLQIWDNSTRGLDSANAIDFCKTLRMSADYVGVTSVVAIYQAPQAAYDVFDKVSVLYQGHQIFFGPTTAAKEYFTRLGFECPEQQTTPDFLTALSSPSERRVRQGFEGKTPSNAAEFAKAWRSSAEYTQLKSDIHAFGQKYPLNSARLEEFGRYRRFHQSKHTRPNSPYTLSYIGQVKLLYRRSFWRWRADPSITIVQIVGNFILALVVGSLYYDLQPVTSSLSQRLSLMFFIVLLNGFGSALEIVTLYAQRPIVEKHDRYAYYHPSADALATIIYDLPWKFLSCTAMNLTLYFMTNLRRDPGHYFFFLLVSFIIFMTMSFFFRAIASSSRTLTQALAPSALILLAMTIYTGYAIPIPYMRGWARWINYLDPIAYGFESVVVNELSGRLFQCNQLVPSGPGYNGLQNQACSSVGSTAGSDFVLGDSYVEASYQYLHSHKWRNVGILIGFMVFFLLWHLLTTEFITAKRSKGELLVYPRKHMPSKAPNADEEKVQPDEAVPSEEANPGVIQKQTAIFSWKDVVYEIPVKGGSRRILDFVDGWVKPGTLTALMGVSGAGKTTLLDVLADRVTMGIVNGEMLVDGKSRDQSFQRKTGYVQQQDVHLSTSTVREALQFSATLRQPRQVSREEKYEYVEEVLKLLEMHRYADAVVGVTGEGLNVEQRKRLSIGVELVAKPELLVFFDEPTSGLDSQTSWSILQLLRKLTKHGQAILCTIHQPSAMLFEQFDRLLFLAKGGKTVYFGPIGSQSKILIDYFTRNGATPYRAGDNPAEWMLAAIGAARGSTTNVDWRQVWIDSDEYRSVCDELESIKQERSQASSTGQETRGNDAYREYAATLVVQMATVTRRVFQQYWRTPSYIWSKICLCTVCALFIGFSYFNADTSQQGLQNQLLGVFMIFTIFSQIIQQIMPNFVIQRELYEARERPSKTYSWITFIVCSIVVEIPWAFLVGTLMFLSWYFPIGGWRKYVGTGSLNLRGAQVWLLLEMFLLFASTFSILCCAGMDDAGTASNVGNLLFALCLTFCGVLVSGPQMPGFWKFMWRATPFTYIVEGMITAAISDAAITCSSTEYLTIQPPSGMNCGDYMNDYINVTGAGGYLLDANATSSCQYCAINDSNRYLARLDLSYSHLWRDFGIIWVYLLVNIAGAIFFYWLFRVPKRKRSGEGQS